MRPLAIDHPGTAYDMSYGYDRQGNVTGWNGVSYAYDGMDRLVTGGYSYDAIGNQATGPGGVSYTYVSLTGGSSGGMSKSSLGGSSETQSIPPITLDPIEWDRDPDDGISSGPTGSSSSTSGSSGNPSMRLLTKTASGVTTDYTDDGTLANLVAVAGKYGSLTYDATNRLLSINDLARGGDGRVPVRAGGEAVPEGRRE